MKSNRRLWQTLMGRRDQLRGKAQTGMTTAEYALGTLAACSQHTSPS